MNLDQLIKEYSAHVSMAPASPPPAWSPDEPHAQRIARETSYTLAAFATFAKSQRLELTVTPIPLSPLEALRALVGTQVTSESSGREFVANAAALNDAIATLKAHDA